MYFRLCLGGLLPFAHQLHWNQTITIDGDLITIQDDADISHAISLSSLLKLTVNGMFHHFSHNAVHVGE